MQELSDPSGPHPEARTALREANKINSFVSCASVSATRRDAPPGGVQPVIVNGEFKWRLSGLYPPTGKQPAFGQYYVLEPETDYEARIAADPMLKPHLSDETIRLLVHQLRESHPLASLYYSAAEVHQKWKADHPNEQLPAFEVLLLTNRLAEAEGAFDASVHPHRTDTPTVDGRDLIALIWINEEGTPNPVEEQAGIRLEGRDGETKYFHHFDPNIFAACYAYLNPHGVQGYRYCF